MMIVTLSDVILNLKECVKAKYNIETKTIEAGKEVAITMADNETYNIIYTNSFYSNSFWGQIVEIIKDNPEAYFLFAFQNLTTWT